MTSSKDSYGTLGARIMAEVGHGQVWAVDFVAGLDSARVGVWLFVESDRDSDVLSADAALIDDLSRLFADEAPGRVVGAVNVCSRERLEREFQGSRFYATR